MKEAPLHFYRRLHRTRAEQFVDGFGDALASTLPRTFHGQRDIYLHRSCPSCGVEG